MENHALDPIIVLKINIRSEECSEMLEKQLLKINGVHHVAINREKKQVTIIGEVDPLWIVKEIAKLGKRAKLLLYDKKPKTYQDSSAENLHKSAQDFRDKHPNGGNQNAGQTSEEKYFGSPDGHPHCKMNNSFDYDKYRAAAKDVEEEMSRERYGQFHSVHKDHKYRAAAKDFEDMCRDHRGKFHSAHDDTNRVAGKQGVEEEMFRDPYGKFHSVHYAKYHTTAKGVEQKMCGDQHGQFRGRRNTNEFVPPRDSEDAQYYSCPDHHPYCKMEDSTHHDNYRATEEMNRGRYDQFYGRRSTNGFVPPRNSEDSKYNSCPDDHSRYAAAKGFEEEMSQGGYYQFHGRSRNANNGYVPPRYNDDMYGKPNGHRHKMGDAFREANMRETIKEAQKDMDRLFSIRRRGNDHFERESSRYHHDTPNPSRWMSEEPPPDDHYHDRNPPPPAFRERMSDFEFREGLPPFEQHRERMPPAPQFEQRQERMPPPSPSSARIYIGRPGSHYDKFTNLFSDENPSSCTIM